MSSQKKILFIGDSFIYYGLTVLNEWKSRLHDEGYFYHLCRETGIDADVTNWTFGGKGLSWIWENTREEMPEGPYDAVILSGGRRSDSRAEAYIPVLKAYREHFMAENPDCRFFYLVSSGAHNISVKESFPRDLLNHLTDFEALGYTVIDWGALVADLIRGRVSVPGGQLPITKNSFIVCRSAEDGYHPGPLAGYLTTLMVWSAWTGQKAEGCPYSFWNDKTRCERFDPEAYIRTYYTCGGTNFPEIFASGADMRGLQILADRYLAAKDYRRYHFEEEMQ